MHLLHKFKGGFEVYFTYREEGDARKLISDGIIELQLNDVVGSARRLMRVNQTHSNKVVNCSSFDGAAYLTAPEADGIVSNNKALALGVLVADCAPVALVSENGVFSAVHAGWRGVYKGILSNTVEEMKQLGANEIQAFVGPCIKSECYEFDGSELSQLSSLLGVDVSGVTSTGKKSLNLGKAIGAALFQVGVTDVEFSPECTACDINLFSYRKSKNIERHLMVVVGADD